MDVPIQESLKSPKAEPVASVSEESAIPIVEEPLPREGMASEIEAALHTASLEGTTLVTMTVEPDVLAVDSFEGRFSLHPFPRLEKITFGTHRLLSFFIGDLFDLIVSETPFPFDRFHPGLAFLINVHEVPTNIASTLILRSQPRRAL